MAAVRRWLVLVTWSIALISLFGGSYFEEIRPLVAPATISFFLLQLSRIEASRVRGWWRTYFVYLFFVTISLLLAVINDNSIQSAMRFYILLAIIPLAAIMRAHNFTTEWNLFKVFSFIKAITVLYIWVDLFFSQDYSIYRIWAQETLAGDIYIFDGFPRVQIIGNTLFVLGFMIDFYRKKRPSLYNIIMVLGAAASGNTAYILGIVVFLLLYYYKRIKEYIKTANYKLLFIVPIVIIGMVYTYDYFDYQYELKKDDSNAVRIEQVDVLLSDMQWYSLMFGNGLAHRITASGQYRAYDAGDYFELQTLYILNQVGPICLLLFYLLTVSAFCRKKDYNRLVVYATYLVFTFWNPNVFDSTQIMVLVMTNSLIDDC